MTLENKKSQAPYIRQLSNQCLRYFRKINVDIESVEEIILMELNLEVATRWVPRLFIGISPVRSDI